MNVILDETRRRHRFIERSLEEAQKVLQNRQVISVLGKYAAELADVPSRLYVPNVRHGEVRAPKVRRRLTGIPVVALRVGEQLRLNPQDFARFTPHQLGAAAASIRSLVPQLKDPEMLAAKFERTAFAPYRRGPLPSWAGIAQLAPKDLAKTSFYDGSVHIESTDFIDAGFPRYSRVKGRPTLALRYEDGVDATDSPTMLHEYKHLRQHQDDPLVATNEHDDTEMYYMGLELEAYHVGALAVAGMRNAGMAVSDRGSQVERDKMRMAWNGGRMDPSPGLLDDLERAGLSL